MDKDSTAPKRSRKRLLLWIALIAASLLVVYSYRYELILMLPSIQAQKIRLITRDTCLPFPTSSRVAEFSSPVFRGPWLDWRSYWIYWDWRRWQYDWENWKSDYPENYVAKVLIPESSYAGFKAAVLKRPSLPSNDLPFGVVDTRWQPANPEFKQVFEGRGFVDWIEILTSREDGNYVIFVAYECK